MECRFRANDALMPYLASSFGRKRVLPRLSDIYCPMWVKFAVKNLMHVILLSVYHCYAVLRR
jgi:hypothetical protein